MTGDIAGWLPEREAEIRRWHASRRGQGWRAGATAEASEPPAR